jgi:hypothetical protein
VRTSGSRSTHTRPASSAGIDHNHSGLADATDAWRTQQTPHHRLHQRLRAVQLGRVSNVGGLAGLIIGGCLIGMS